VHNRSKISPYDQGFQEGRKIASAQAHLRYLRTLAVDCIQTLSATVGKPNFYNQIRM
jgi:hypothetical protein